MGTTPILSACSQRSGREAGTVHLVRFHETVRIGRADPDEAAALDTTTGAPLLRLIRLASTAEHIVEVNEITMLGDRYELYYDLPAT
ncbi:UTRA domain-containing protein [Pseudonocardia sp. HH130630-07]|uniref:UTRA domain-containing protein n=1 Tax=Pseudonocardia sp. HH130630-07 TaxID=1690815 RepID=UPI0018D3DBCD|nr:UTRA domain-containing protein [Pseudonocardia sp. HH130630-07]